MGTQGDDGLILPPELPLTASSLQSDSCMLLDDGQELLMWIGLKTPADFLFELFGVETIVERVTQYLIFTKYYLVRKNGQIQNAQKSKSSSERFAV